MYREEGGEYCDRLNPQRSLPLLSQRAPQRGRPRKSQRSRSWRTSTSGVRGSCFRRNAIRVTPGKSGGQRAGIRATGYRESADVMAERGFRMDAWVAAGVPDAPRTSMAGKNPGRDAEEGRSGLARHCRHPGPQPLRPLRPDREPGTGRSTVKAWPEGRGNRLLARCSFLSLLGIHSGATKGGGGPA